MSNNFGFLNYFLTSAKEGTNVDESMKCLLEYIIERMIKFCNENGIDFGQKRKDSLKIKNDKNIIRKQENNSCC